MYKSPIEVVVSQFQEMIIQQQDEQTLQAIQKVGIKVDKDELVKALSYDRKQYEKGYVDGVMEFAEGLISQAKSPDNIQLVFVKQIIDLAKEMVGAKNG